MKKQLYFILRSRNIIVIAAFFILSVTVLFFISSDKSLEASSLNGYTIPTIIIDAGHGGEDGGTQSSDGVLEKDINLKISLKIKEILDDYGFNTVTVRDGDYMIYDKGSESIREKKKSDLNNRLQLTVEYPDAILISVHQNYFTDSKYYGAQVFYSSRNSDSKTLADSIQSSIVNDVQPDNKREIKETGKNIFLLYNCEIPAVMVECGFMSNYNEALKLNDDAYQNKIANSIVKGIKNYIFKKVFCTEGG